MTNLRDVNIGFQDSPAIDGFGRLRTSQPILLTESKRVGSVPDLLMTDGTSGSGSVSYQANRSSNYLQVGTAIGKATRQTKTRAVYQPGKSLELLQTFVMDSPESSLFQRVGYFDDNDGVFFEKAGATVTRITLRSSTSGSPVDTQITQDNWNIDPMDGTGPSGITLDFTKSQILFTDIEWLGVGRVRIGFVVHGLIYYVHEFLNTNSLDVVYMKNSNLPLRWEIECTAAITGTRTLEQICGSASSEGGYEVTGITASVNMGNTNEAVGGNSTEEILAIRMQSGFTDYCTAFIQSLSTLAETSGDFLWELRLNPTETGAGTWTSVSNSIMESNVGRTVTAGTGTLIASGYASSDSDVANLDQKPVLRFGTDLDGTTDVFSVMITNVAGGSESFLAAIAWREIY